MTSSRDVNPIARELADIKRLLILQLINAGVQTTQIASALGVHKSVVSRLVPARLVAKKTKKA